MIKKVIKGIGSLVTIGLCVVTITVVYTHVTSGVGLKEQLNIILSSNNNTNESITEDISLGIVSLPKRKGILQKEIKIGSRFGDIFDLDKLNLAKKNSKRKNRTTLSDILKNGNLVEKGEVYYEYDIDNKFYIIGINDSDLEKPIEDTRVVAIGTNIDMGYTCYKGVKLGLDKDTVHDIFNSSKSINSEDNHEIYYDDFGNYIMLKYRDSKVSEILVGTTGGMIGIKDLISPN